MKTQRRRTAGLTVNIKDVALAAGVSTATVSRALRQQPSVTLSTRNRINRIAAAMGYSISPSAAALATGRSRIITVLTPTVRHWFYSKALEGASRALAARNYSLNIVVTDPHDCKHIATLGPSHVDALLIFGNAAESGTALLELTGSTLPCAIVGGRASRGHSVGVDEQQILSAAVRHLRQSGHKRIALLIADSYVWIEEDTGCPELLEAVRKSLSHRATESPLEAFTRTREVFEKLWTGWTSGPAAFICPSDEAAIGILFECARRGVKIPEQVAVVSLEGNDLAAPLGLTSILQHPADQAALAVRILLDELAGASGEPTSVTTPFELIVRSSSSPQEPPAALPGSASSAKSRPENSRDRIR
ncbi:LacI family DNA-binding transcriptional regulator [Arthrobacter sp. ISL-48]|uniref:LacI family DNA-binding transcriptional regulator n=1 Tax=Arthrobacter sp. ISL-48 TaxID=2819110 RepID=UPI001BE4E60E|nr:LacI family DNA-binding transcriptional regulator [Arthrobacter sp. ISL-48]MBT2533960.1 LacI family DNA-binding transcriptional regulator [Arthrobacter sp. ISL-48]